MEHPPIPDSLKDHAKEPLDVVYAAGPNGKTYAIPLAVADKYPCEEKHPALPDHATVARKAEEASEDEEVGGRHAVVLADGSFGYHANWAYGPYIWWKDGGSYRGIHRHPYGWTNPLAVDADDL